GSGKSTIAQLIPRFWDVQKGTISVGGVDIRAMKTGELMDAMSFVFQDTFLFSDTLYNNILAGRPSAAREDVYRAAKAAQCHTFIERLPKGYDTLIGEGGVHLSGGEAQRVSVARAILKNAPILILDEATAYADPENEYEMQLALGELIKGKTVLIIAHRLTTICEADQIIVLRDGTIEERGTHRELLARGGLYKNMWVAYTSSTDWTVDLRKEKEVFG
ncbi:ATP-binding cassette domain-containing protein, partial [Mesorhizobium sp. M00.F.Ca.ET.186.01.1.1]